MLQTFIIPLLRHFTILGQKNAQNMPRYNILLYGRVSQGLGTTKFANLIG